jgi:hypothetical protein
MAWAIPIIAAIAGGASSAGFSKLFSGDKDKMEQYSRLNPTQQKLLKQLQDAISGQGAGGAFGTAADYYRDLLSNDSETMKSLSAPELRRFNEDIIPGISEQFAGMGAGGLSSSGFRNAAVNAGTDLSERLGAIRAGLRAQGAQGLTNLGGLGLENYTNNVHRPGNPGFAETAAPAFGEAVTQGVSNWLTPTPTETPPTTSAQGKFGLPDFLQTSLNNKPISSKGRTSPYGRMGMSQPGQFGLPNFGGR